MTAAHIALWLFSLLLVWIAAQTHQRQRHSRIIDDLLAEIKALNTQQQEAHAHITFLEQELNVSVAITAKLKDSLTRRFASVYSPEIDKQPETLFATEHTAQKQPESVSTRIRRFAKQPHYPNGLMADNNKQHIVSHHTLEEMAAYYDTHH